MKTSNGAFRALADPTRRDILSFLRRGARTSGEVASQFESSWPTISRHLAVLRDAGLVTAERQGQEIYYELNTSVFQDLVQQVMSWAESDAPSQRAVSRRPAKQQA
jgi:DNA-binding transcriptional ArsR family regulator